MGDELDVLLSRRSVGRVTTDPVPRDVVDELLLAATHAPNHHLTAPWRFIVLTGAARRAVGKAHAAAVVRQRPDAGTEVITRESARLERAPVVVVCIVRTDRANVVRAREDRDAVAAAVQNLLLAANIKGLAAMWRTGAIVDEPEVGDALGLTTDDAIVAFVYLGIGAVTPPDRQRQPLEDVVEWRDR